MSCLPSRAGSVPLSARSILGVIGAYMHNSRRARTECNNDLCPSCSNTAHSLTFGNRLLWFAPKVNISHVQRPSVKELYDRRRKC